MPRGSLPRTGPRPPPTPGSFAGLHGVGAGQVAGPIPSADGKAIQTIVSVNLGAQGWNGAATAASSIRAITGSNANGLTSHITGPLGNAADSSKVFKGIDSTLLYATLAVVIVILLITYRSPALWLLPVLSAGVALITAEAVVYLLAAHAGLTVNAQSAGILAGAGVRRQHRLCAADRRALPGGTAPPRSPPCGDGRGAAARGPGDHRQRLPPSSSRC